MRSETFARPALGRVARVMQVEDLARRRGRVRDLIGLIIEATGLQVEMGEICLVGDGRDRPRVPTEVVGFRGGRTLLMPLGELSGIGPGTSVHPTGSPFKVAMGDGLLGLEVFVRLFGFGSTVLAGACTLALLVLPVVILASREALRTVPDQLREGCYALGATKWQTIRQVVLPSSYAGILTGAILAVARAMGETAPLIVVGAVVFITFTPDMSSQYTALPIQIFNWVSMPQKAFLENAAAAILVLMIVLLLLNSVAIVLRAKYQRRT